MSGCLSKIQDIEEFTTNWLLHVKPWLGSLLTQSHSNISRASVGASQPFLLQRPNLFHYPLTECTQHYLSNTSLHKLLNQIIFHRKRFFIHFCFPKRAATGIARTQQQTEAGELLLQGSVLPENVDSWFSREETSFVLSLIGSLLNSHGEFL